jgi:hypothetical protein
MKAIKITLEEAKANSRNEYNSYEWNKKIDMYNRLADVEWYLNEANDLFVVYTTEGEQIRFLNEVSYASSLTSNGFKLVEIKDGEIKAKLYTNVNGKTGVIDNTKPNREIMSLFTKNFCTIFTNLL